MFLRIDTVRGCAVWRWRLVEATKGRILLAEDDGALREIFSEYLEAAGFSVVSAENASEALAMASQAPIDLLITDMTLTGMSGAELADSLGARLPGLPVLLVSGSVPADVEPTTRRSYLQKPFSGDELVAKVRQMLSGRVPSGSSN